jgi:hypothetical protein
LLEYLADELRELRCLKDEIVSSKNQDESAKNSSSKMTVLARIMSISKKTLHYTALPS